MGHGEGCQGVEVRQPGSYIGDEVCQPELQLLDPLVGTRRRTRTILLRPLLLAPHRPWLRQGSSWRVLRTTPGTCRDSEIRLCCDREGSAGGYIPAERISLFKEEICGRKPTCFSEKHGCHYHRGLAQRRGWHWGRPRRHIRGRFLAGADEASGQYPGGLCESLVVRNLEQPPRFSLPSPRRLAFRSESSFAAAKGPHRDGCQQQSAASPPPVQPGGHPGSAG
mmetsp:Transcript_110690/g.246996  ORF Transcript_110690/g.246996 Transcript_110690/m.246996 type:complete len:223 (-) Transcript_110690:566-1234(-)